MEIFAACEFFAFQGPDRQSADDQLRGAEPARLRSTGGCLADCKVGSHAFISNKGALFQDHMEPTEEPAALAALVDAGSDRPGDPLLPHRSRALR